MGALSPTTACVVSLLDTVAAEPARSSLAKARDAVDRALSVDPNLPAGHSTRAYTLMLSEYDWSQAEQEFRRAVSAAPNEATIRQQYASFLAITGRTDESLREARTALALDPQSPSVMQTLGAMLLMARRYDEGLIVIRRAAAAEPNNQIAWSNRWHFAWQSNRLDEAFDALVGLQSAARLEFVTRTELSQAFASGGKPAVLRLLLAKWPETYRPIHRAMWYAELGDPDHAMQWLERGYEERWIALPYVVRYPPFDSMKSDPRFVALLHKMGLNL